MGEIRIDDLRMSVLAQEEKAWHECDLRQRSYDVHHDT
jgi:hypothetical protein